MSGFLAAISTDESGAFEPFGFVPGSADGEPSTSDDSAGDTGVAALLARMQQGDREAVAEFIEKYGGRIRRRLRAKLSPAMRRIFDSQEILSTLARRLDTFVKEHKLQADNENRLWSLVLTISDRALIDKARVFRRLANAEGPDGPLARGFLTRLHDAEAAREDGALDELNEALQAMPEGEDRQILSMWLQEIPHTIIAEELHITPAAVRKRWQAIRERLRERIEKAA